LLGRFCGTAGRFPGRLDLGQRQPGMVEKGSSGGGQFDAVHDAGDVIVRRGDNAHSMYFIAAARSTFS
jgi:hypothetical protein